MKLFLSNLRNKKKNTSLNSCNETGKASEKKIFSEFLKIVERYKFKILNLNYKFTILNLQFYCNLLNLQFKFTILKTPCSRNVKKISANNIIVKLLKAQEKDKSL